MLCTFIEDLLPLFFTFPFIVVSVVASLAYSVIKYRESQEARRKAQQSSNPEGGSHS